MKTAIIPFQGFYGSIHEGELDQTLELMFTDQQGEHSDALEMRAYIACDWRKVREDYAKEYAERFVAAFNIPGCKFESLQSPREYNFTTDRVFVTLTREALRFLVERTSKETLAAVCQETFTSRDGFHSFYSPDYKDWGKVETWDHNQLGALVEAFVRDSLAGEELNEYELMEDAICNGAIDGIIYDAIAGIDRLLKIRDYLEARAQRGQA